DTHRVGELEAEAYASESPALERFRLASEGEWSDGGDPVPGTEAVRHPGESGSDRSGPGAGRVGDGRDNAAGPGDRTAGSGARDRHDFSAEDGSGWDSDNHRSTGRDGTDGGQHAGVGLSDAEATHAQTRDHAVSVVAERLHLDSPQATHALETAYDVAYEY